MSPKEAKNKFEDAVSENLAAFEFVRTKNNRLIHDSIEVISIIHFSYLKTGQDFQAVVNVASRHRQVEDVANSWNEDITARVARRTATLGVELGALIGDGQQRYELSTTMKIDSSAKSLAERIRHFGIDYLDRNKHRLEVIRRFRSIDLRERHQTRGGIAIRLPTLLALELDLEGATEELARQRLELQKANDILLGRYEQFASKFHQFLDTQRSNS